MSFAADVLAGKSWARRRAGAGIGTIPGENRREPSHAAPTGAMLRVKKDVGDY
jgi:hypothetical protein